MKMRKMTFFYWLVKSIVLVLAKVFFRLQVKGLQNIPATGGVIIAPNHVSYIDPPVIGASIPIACHYFAKEELFQHRFLGNLIRHLFAIPVKRGAFDRNAMRMASDILKNDGLLLFFPEGTRSVTGELQDAKSGISMLANQSGAAVVPVYISGSHDVLPRDSTRIHCSKVTITFGKPIRFAEVGNAEMDKKSRYEIFAQTIMQEIANLRSA